MTTMSIRHHRALPVAAVVLLLVACGSSPEEDPPAGPDTPVPVPAETTAGFEPVDRTDEVTEGAGDDGGLVTSATETEAGRIEVATSIVDPRTEGSPEAASAVAICEAAVAVGAEYVSVLEEDGTSFVLYGHPSVPAGECAEV